MCWMVQTDPPNNSTNSSAMVPSCIR
jgi:hypothetical protein